MRTPWIRIGAVGIVAASGLAAVGAGEPLAAAKPPGLPSLTLELLGEQIIPTGAQFEDTEVGGLSSLAYDAGRDVFYAISDDQGVIDPVRFYTLRLDLADGRFDPGDVHVVDVTTLVDAGGQPFTSMSLDPEGLALTPDDRLVVTSEGIATRNIDPFVRLFDLEGHQLAELPLPAAFRPTSATTGVRQNLGFESAAVTPNGGDLLVGTEAALVQDGPAASLAGGSPARILRYRLRTGEVIRQVVYMTDPIAEPPVPAGSFAVNGLVELLPLNGQEAIAMERSFSVGAPGTGNTIKLYLIKLAAADDVNGVDSIAAKLARTRTVRKELLLDLDTLGRPLDNIEGMAFGPMLPDGRRTLLLASDNNFSPTAFTQFLVFAVS